MLPGIRQCEVEGCDHVVSCHGLCSTHYTRWRKYGDVHVVHPGGRKARPLEERFWELVVKKEPPGCWVWTGTQGGKAGYSGEERYGYFRLTGKRARSVRAHRFAYELLVGAIPSGLVLDHLCRNPLCVNPAHLEPVTQAENMRRSRLFESVAARHAARTHCVHGHRFTPENTYVPADGRRRCRTCQRVRAARHRAAR